MSVPLGTAQPAHHAVQRSLIFKRLSAPNKKTKRYAKENRIEDSGESHANKNSQRSNPTNEDS